ncbi:hypothetical protein EVAR_72855_1 [Eumeta japonica]|uniref:DUF243 domain-containing protein n=1 Tax=Eumeta variegata TaxID=151549 RepID=A0A4C1TLR3_EUMVA|nr:hypothetical protein EVAR_72855_1 [Eumeta japonica]
MRSSILFALSLVVVTAATPQLGYGYEQQQLSAYPAIGGHHGGDKYLPPGTTSPKPLVRKQFFTISAPKDDDGQPKNKHLVLGRPQRNYRVIFIKAPTSENVKLKYSAEYAPQEEKTVIYVLSKKDNELDASDIATPSPSAPTKPEVFFIKYKTPEEADAAQSEIQNEYAKLEGTNNSPMKVQLLSHIYCWLLRRSHSRGSYNYQPIAAATVHKTSQFISQYLPSVTKW